MSTALAPSEPLASSSVAVATRPSLGLLKPIAPPAQIITQQNEMRGFIKEVLEEGRDYGTIPGVDKPSLLQPGAQRINVGFGIIPHYTTLEAQVDHDRVVEWSKRKKIFKDRQWTGDWSIESGTSIGVYRYVVRCELVHRDTGIVVGESLGACSTLEAKYIDRPRDSENTCLRTIPTARRRWRRRCAPSTTRRCATIARRRRTRRRRTGSARRRTAPSGARR